MKTFLPSLLQGQALRPVTRRLVERLWLDLPLAPAEIVDFGVATEQHYRALRAMLLNDPAPAEAPLDEEGVEAGACKALRQRIRALEAALGQGPKLNELVRQYAPEYADQVHFHTSWDELWEHTEAVPEEG